MRLDRSHLLKLLSTSIRVSRSLLAQGRMMIADPVQRRKLNYRLLVATACMYVGIFWIALRPPAVKPAAVKSVAQAQRSAPAISAQESKPVEAPAAAPAVAPAAPPAENVAAAPVAAEPTVESKPAAKGSMPNGRKLRQARLDYINDDLGLDVVKAADETLAEEKEMRRGLSPSLLKSVGISKKQYLMIKMREQRLAEKLKDADQKGASRLRRVLVNDHTDWMKEYLGPNRYERFMELSSNNG